MRVLVVDDSALMRKHLAGILRSEADIEVEVARNGSEAVRLVEEYQPDVVTLDINMPEMDGLSALSLIMVQRPTPVVMVSSLTSRGATATLEALALGAVDFIAKPEGTISLSIDGVREQILSKVRQAAKARLAVAAGRPGTVERRRPPAEAVPVAAPPVSAEMPLVVIGVSTGGPRTLETILPALPANFPAAVLIAQHMPANFTAALAQRLDQSCQLPVREVSGPTPLRPGEVWFGRGGADLTLSRRAGRLLVSPVPEDRQFCWHPSVSRLMASANQLLPPEQLIGVMLTGMGNDGAEEMTVLHRNGGRTIAESEASSVVFGMPADLIRRGGASAVHPAEQVAEQLLHWLMH
ncbi:chemotaxis-specific protein-glutamate methyltransferase CheB [Chitinimonas lacunae]|uniref:Protein-glutamate methylesterase/protein-glutamine glutaminase n=1 Tax=Chitinimonas lacunae TaxID=1963018 RepID=A0ABV8MID0_9NEIS